MQQTLPAFRSQRPDLGSDPVDHAGADLIGCFCYDKETPITTTALCISATHPCESSVMVWTHNLSLSGFISWMSKVLEHLLRLLCTGSCCLALLCLASLCLVAVSPGLPVSGGCLSWNDQRLFRPVPVVAAGCGARCDVLGCLLPL